MQFDAFNQLFNYQKISDFGAKKWKPTKSIQLQKQKLI